MTTVSLGFEFCSVMSLAGGVIGMMSSSTVLAKAPALQLFIAAIAREAGHVLFPRQLPPAWCCVLPG